MASDQRARGRVSGRSLLILLVALLIVSPLGQAGARRVLQGGPSDSPAIGGSQVTTQGIAELPDGEIVYRVVKRTAPARGGAKVGRRVLSIVLATDEPVLLSNEREDGTILDIARVAPGESYLVQAGTRQIRSSLDNESVEYLAVEIVRESSGPDIGNGELLFLSDPFTAPEGPRDIDFVRNILEGNDVGLVPDSGNTVAILATDGAIDILPANGTPTTLQAGESAIFPAGDIEIEAATTTANGVPTNQLAGLTSSLQADPGDAAYVVTVIGEEVPATGVTPTATSRSGNPDPGSAASPSAEPGATTEPNTSANGTIGVQAYLCPATTVATLDPAACKPTMEGFGASIDGGGTTRTLADSTSSATGYFWIGIPLTTYTLTVDPLPDGFTGYYVPGSAAVGGSAEDGYTLTVDETSPAITVPIYFLAAEAQAPRTSSVTALLYRCLAYDPNTGPDNCSPEPVGEANMPYLAGIANTTGSYDAASAVVNGNSCTWTAVPVGDYALGQSGWANDYVVNGTYTNGGGTYPFEAQPPSVTLEVYNIEPILIT